MSYLSIPFYIFCLLFFFVYYSTPKNYRYLIVLLGSYVFYGYGNLFLLLFLVASTLITYMGGLLLDKSPRKSILILSFIANLALLIGFKYTNFFIYNLNLLSSKLLGNIFYLHSKNIILPIGLSFYIFQSCTYLTDVYRRNIPAEKNILLYAAFVSFFPTILSGPIQKSRDLLPQLKNPASFCDTEAKKGTVLFIWGLFEKVLVANNLLLIVNKIYSNYSSYNAIYLFIAAICFSLYIYADFSSYSDMARGVAKIMGINVGKNFDNPYLSTTVSEFWNRWHMSLNQWFIENIYIPLGGNRKGTIRKYINILIVFLISGLWHGAQWHFVAWGLINGLFVVAGQIVKPIKSKIYHYLNIDENIESILFLKRLTVFFLISVTWIFFQNGIKTSIYIIKTMSTFQLMNIFDSGLLSIAGSSTVTFVTVAMTIIFCVVQCKRQNEHHCFIKFERQPLIFQCALCAVILVVCVFSLCSSNAQINTQFLYFQF